MEKFMGCVKEFLSLLNEFLPKVEMSECTERADANGGRDEDGDQELGRGSKLPHGFATGL